MKICTCHIVDGDRYLRDGNTVRICLTDNKDIADIWILPVDNATYAEMKVDIVKSYESPKYTAYLCSQTEYNYKKADLEREKTKISSDDDSIWSGVETIAGYFKNAIAEHERDKAQREANAKAWLEKEHSRWNSLSGKEQEAELKQLNEDRKKSYQKNLKKLPKMRLFYFIKIVLALGIIGLGVDGLFSVKEKHIKDISSFIEVSMYWILILACFIGALVLLGFATHSYFEFKGFLKGGESDFGKEFDGTSRREITDLVVPKNIKVIKKGSYKHCENLRRVIIPEGVTRIETQAFWGCKNLMSVTIPSSVKTIGEVAFGCCDKLVEIFNYSSLNIKKDEDFIEDNGCIAQNAVVIHTQPESSIIKEIGDYFFIVQQGKYKLIHYKGEESKLVLPDNVDGKSYDIYDNAFSGCELVQIVIPGCVETIGKFAFRGCICLEKVIISEGVKQIDSFAFSNCKDLVSISIPNSVETIGMKILSGCYKVKSYNDYK